jgi:hypothetical protein
MSTSGWAEVGYGSPSEYIGSLIREDREPRARCLLRAGLDSESDLVTPDYLAELRREAKERTQRRRKDQVQLVSSI